MPSVFTLPFADCICTVTKDGEQPLRKNVLMRLRMELVARTGLTNDIDARLDLKYGAYSSQVLPEDCRSIPISRLALTIKLVGLSSVMLQRAISQLYSAERSLG